MSPGEQICNTVMQAVCAGIQQQQGRHSHSPRMRKLHLSKLLNHRITYAQVCSTFMCVCVCVYVCGCVCM